MSDRPEFAAVPPGRLAPIREALAAAGFQTENVMATLELTDLRPARDRQRLVLHNRTGGGRPLDTLVRLFIAGFDVPQQAFAAAVAPTATAEWCELGFVEPVDGGVRAALLLRPYGRFVVASDFPRHGPAGSAVDHVMGITPSSITLAGLTIRRPGGAVLDLGSGCGFQALLAREHAERVVAADINPRAAAMARLNALLNRAELDARTGDLFATAAPDERFDLIVSNPPFIVAPGFSHYYLHSGLGGDEICRRIAGAAPGHLSEDGFCQFLAHWIVPEGGGWAERLAGWFEGSGCNSWVMQTHEYTPEEYAVTWMELAGEDDDEVAVFDSWLAHFEEQGISGVASGLVTMQRSGDGRERLFVDRGPTDMMMPAGDDVAAGFAMRVRLATTDDEALLALRPRLSSRVRLEQAFTPGEGAWSAAGSHLHRTAGLQYAGSMDAYGAAMLGRADGRRTLGELLTGVAADAGAPAVETIAEGLPKMRTLLEQGFLELD